MENNINKVPCASFLALHFLPAPAAISRIKIWVTSVCCLRKEMFLPPVESISLWHEHSALKAENGLLEIKAELHEILMRGHQ